MGGFEVREGFGRGVFDALLAESALAEAGRFGVDGEFLGGVELAENFFAVGLLAAWLAVFVMLSYLLQLDLRRCERCRAPLLHSAPESQGTASCPHL